MAEQEKFTPELFKSSPYRPAAYKFVLRALEFSVRRLPKRRHISGQELLAGICDYARQIYGPLAAEVFRSWGITRTIDFGEIVFELVQRSFLSRREQDSKEDFRSDFSFSEGLENGYDYLSDFHVVRDSCFPHAVPLSPEEKKETSGGGTFTADFQSQ